MYVGTTTTTIFFTYVAPVSIIGLSLDARSMIICLTNILTQTINTKIQSLQDQMTLTVLVSGIYRCALRVLHALLRIRVYAAMKRKNLT